jgi:hypothetical protein
MGLCRRVSRRPKKRRSALIPYLRDLARGTNDRLPADSLLYRAGVARTLNQLMGTSRFDAWNIADVPDEDLTEIRMSLQWLEELKDG